MQVQTVQKTVAHLYVYAMCAPVGNVCTRRKSDVWFNATLRCVAEYFYEAEGNQTSY